MTLLMVRQLLEWLVFPPGVLLLGLAIGAVFAARGRWRIAFAMLALPCVMTLVLALPNVANRIVAPIEQRALSESQAGLAARPLPRVAVVLGGAVGVARIENGPTNMTYDLSAAADRVVAATRLWHDKKVDLLVFAGGSDYATSEAELMARFAVDLGVPRSAMLLEGESRNTRENAQRVAALLRANGLGTDVALVTSAIHIPRAMAEFRCAGLSAVAVPAEFDALGVERARPGALAFIPSLGSIDKSQRGIKEWVGAMVGGCAV
jgi:uncharacterized SAM-binding protein YcdF (DUF218 family)